MPNYGGGGSLGSEYYSAISGAGQDIGQGIANAALQYHKEHVAYDQAHQTVDALSRVGIDSNHNLRMIQDGGKTDTGEKLQPILDPKFVEQYQARNRQDWARSTGAYDALIRLGAQVIQKKANQSEDYPVNIPGVGTVNLSGQEAAAYSARVNRPAGATVNPDLNFTHAVNAHNAQVGQIEDYFTSNYGVSPADVLNSGKQQGFVWNPDTKGYENATGDRVKNPDLVQIDVGAKQETGEVKDGKKVTYQPTTWLTQDQIQTLRPQAETWQELQQNPPKRSDYRTAAPSFKATGSFIPDARALQIRAAYKTNQISADQAIEAIKALQAQ